MTAQPEQNEPDQPQQPEVVNVLVNETSIAMNKGQHSAESILSAATAQGVSVQEDFVVRIENENRKTELVTDPVEIVEGTRIIAIAPDDNS